MSASGLSTPTPTLTAAVCQFTPTADKESNRARVAELVADAAGRGAQLVVLPEYTSYFVDPMDESLREHAESTEGLFVQSLQRLAQEHDIVIVAGLIETGQGDKVRNTLVAVDAAGLRAVYRKQHLYDAFGQSESDWIEPGEVGSAEVIDVAGFQVGLMTCYDLRFPEVARTLVDAGAEVIVVPAQWVRGPLKEHHWMTLLAARAIENTSYVVAADHPAGIGVGRSVIVDPQGVVLAGLGTEEGVALAQLRRDVLERTRTVNPALRLRRYRVLPR